MIPVLASGAGLAGIGMNTFRAVRCGRWDRHRDRRTIVQVDQTDAVARSDSRSSAELFPFRIAVSVPSCLTPALSRHPCRPDGCRRPGNMVSSRVRNSLTGRPDSLAGIRSAVDHAVLAGARASLPKAPPTM